IFGQVCRPVGPGPFALVVVNHGGASGLATEWNGGTCASVARAGYVQVESSYRGEDGSDGPIEGCAGAGDDVLGMLQIARGLPFVDGRRIAMWGPSHGGCITLRALEKGAKVTVAADVFGITNMTAEYDFWRTELTAGQGPTADYQTLVGNANTAI